MKIYLTFFILLSFFAHRQNSEPGIFECRQDEMLLNQSEMSTNQKGLLGAILTAAFKERKKCAQRHGSQQQAKLLHYYTVQEDRVAHAIRALENAENECRLDAANFADNTDLRNFLIQAFDARIADCAVITRWMQEGNDQQAQLETMVAMYRKKWKESFQAVSDVLDEKQKTESTTFRTEGTTKSPENNQGDHNVWMIIAIALFCSNCLFAMGLIAVCIRKPKCRSVHSPPAHDSSNDEQVGPQQAWQIPVHHINSPRPLVTPLYGSRGVSFDDMRDANARR